MTPTPALLKQIVRLSIPHAAIHVGQGVMGLVDSMFLGRVGATELAAVSLGNGIFFAFTTLGLGVVLGAEPLISQAVGADDEVRAARGLRVAMLVAAAVSLPVLVLVGVTLGLLGYAGIDADVVEATRVYVLGRTPGLFFFFGFLALKAYLQAFEINAPAVWGVVIANVINVPLDGVLIFGDGALDFVGLPGLGLPALGVLGSGLASSVASASRFFILVGPTRRELARRRDDEGELLERWRLACTAARVRRVVRVGLPIGLQLFGEVSMFAVISVLMGTIGKEQLAAHQISLQLASIPFHMTLGIGTATTVVVGQQIGRGGGTGALRGGLVGVAVGLCVMSVSMTLFLTLPELFVAAFTDDRTVIDYAVVLIQIAAAFALFDGTQAVAAGALRGAGDTLWAFLGHLLASWFIGVPVALFLGFGLELGPPGLWWGLVAGLGVAAVILLTRFVTAARRGYLALEE